MKKAVIDCRMPQAMRNKLCALYTGIELYEVFCDNSLELSVSAHPDMNLLTIGSKRFTTQRTLVRQDCDNLIKRQDGILMYPLDAELNAVCIDNDFICRKKSVNSDALVYAESLGMRIINVNQGYTKCNLAIIDEKSKAVITEDVGIARILRMCRYDVLLLSTHSVNLKPYRYGFIGGACGTTNDEIVFCGNIKKHPEFETISAFCKKHGKELVSLDENELYDYGSILFLDD